MINKDCSNIIIVCYPAWTGGKFLINSLGLSEGGVLQQHLYLDYNYEQKIQYIKNLLTETQTTKIWKDLNLGCEQLFSIDRNSYKFQYHDIILQKLGPAVHKFTNDSKYFFLVAHDTLELKSQLKFWKNAKVIFFSNYKSFLDKRRTTKPVAKNLVYYWNTIKGPGWPDQPPTTIAELKLLPKFIQDELANEFENWILTYINYPELFDKNYSQHSKQIINQLGPDRSYVWNCDYSYENVSNFLQEIQKIYNWLDLKIVNLEDLEWYYQEWTKTISMCSNS